MNKSCHIWLIIILLVLSGYSIELHGRSLRIVSYNVENLFHPKHDSIYKDSTYIEKDDWEWTLEGERRWSYSRYYKKVENIARVLTNIGEWEGVDIVGLQEIENALCLKRICYTLRLGEYDFVHYESPDARGIDVGLIYRRGRIDTLSTRCISVPGLVTRDVLYVCASVDKKDTLHIIACHLPSQRGGKAETEWKRGQARKVVQDVIDSIYTSNAGAHIIVMGDMNSTAAEDIEGMHNRMMEYEKRGQGTHKYKGTWSCLDQYYTSPSLDKISDVKIYDAEWIQETDERYMGLRPKRTYNGFKYQNGYSDHLPIIIDIDFTKDRCQK